MQNRAVRGQCAAAHEAICAIVQMRALEPYPSARTASVGSTLVAASAGIYEAAEYRLSSRSAAVMAEMPEYYILDLDKTVSETVAPHMPTPEQIAANTWLLDRDLAVYVEEFERTGFQGGLNWYRAGGYGAAEREMYAGLTIDQPSVYIAGASDWGSYQSPGVLERMQEVACTDMRGVHMIDGAGHWVQQEKADDTARLLIEFLREV